MRNILIHYPFIPSYRVPVFNELAKDERFNCYFLSAIESDDDTFNTLSDGWRFEHIETKLYSFNFIKKKLNVEFGVIRHLLKLRKRGSYYVLLSNPNIISSWLYAIAGKFIGYKVIFWGHGLLKKDKGMKGVLRKIYYKIPDKHWLYGNNGKELLIEQGVDGNKIDVIYNSLDYSKQKKYRELYTPDRESIRRELGYNDNDFVIIVIGRLLKKLRIEQLIEFASKSDNLNVLIIGDGPERDNLHRLSKEIGFEDKVVFTGSVYDEELLGKYYIASDSSIIFGTVGLAAIHSMAYGVPVITHSDIESHCPEVEAIKEGVTGEFFNINELKTLELAIKRIKEGNSYRENCILEIESNYTPENQVEIMLNGLGDSYDFKHKVSD